MKNIVFVIVIWLFNTWTLLDAELKVSNQEKILLDSLPKVDDIQKNLPAGCGNYQLLSVNFLNDFFRQQNQCVYNRHRWQQVTV